MTTQNTLQAGRELDARVAEKVMGRTLPTHEQMVAEALRVWEVQPQCVVFNMGFQAWRIGDEIEVEYTRSLVSEYSTSIEAAWLVVEKRMAAGEFYEAIISSDGVGLSVWRKDADREWDTPIAIVYAETLPLAICIAALNAMEATL
jgi:hypothetical protein